MRGLTREGIVEPLDISRDEILRREWGHGKCVQLTIMKEDCQPLRVVPILHHGLNGQVRVFVRYFGDFGSFIKLLINRKQFGFADAVGISHKSS